MAERDRAADVSEPKSPTALISYSHDSLEHERAVLELCNRLRARGVDSFIDQFLQGAPSEGWPLWMERQIEQRDFTLMVCTEAYQRRFMEIETHGIGRGVVWEARILRNLLYEDPHRHGRIIPVLLAPDAAAFVPTIFRGHFYDLSDERGFESLLRHLLQEPSAQTGALGSLGPQGSRWSAFERPWLVPDAIRTRYFTGREALLARLRRQLMERHRAALSGLGGGGKTQTAIEYAVRHRADYPDGVFWVNAETTAGLTSGFVAIATTLRLAAAASNDQEQIVRAVLEWLNGNDRWLLILDNVEERDNVASFLPLRGAGHILITSRESVFQGLGIARGIEVADLDSDEALRFVLTRTGRGDADLQERAAITDLSLELGNLPLALEQAAAYITETNATFAAYLSAFRKRRIALLERSAGRAPHETVAVTWAANFEAVERASRAAADVLRVSALFAPDAIPFELFINGAEAMGEAITQALADADDLAMAELLRPLARYSLIRSDAALRAFSVHRLVQEIVWAALPEAQRRANVERAVCALDAALPEVEFATWAQCERLVPHGESIAERVDANDVQPEAAGRVLNRTGRYLRERGRFAEAERLHERALAICERALGPDHPEVARSLLAVGIVHRELGRYAEALPLYERALAIRERALGPDHPDVAFILNSLAIVEGGQGRNAEAQSLYERALAIRERALGPGHPDVARTLNNLAEAHLDQARYAEAQALSDRALGIFERTLGPEHPHVGYSLMMLGETCANQGRYAEAQALYERALAIWERALGPDHRLIAESLDDLANVHAQQRCYVDAERLFERALAIKERALGPDHPDVAHSLIGFASLRNEQRRAAEAVALYERALAIKERTFAADHPELAALRGTIDALRAET